MSGEREYGEVWECGPHTNAWNGHDARCRKVRITRDVPTQAAPQDAGGLSSDENEALEDALSRADELQGWWSDDLQLDSDDFALALLDTPADGLNLRALIERILADRLAADRVARDRAHEDEVAAAVEAERERIAVLIGQMPTYSGDQESFAADAAALARADRSAT